MNFLKKSLASLMVVIMMLTSIPLQGFVDFELPQWFSFDAQAADVEPVVSEEVYLSGTEMVSADVEETETEDNKSFFDRFINSGALKSDAEDFLEVLQNSSISDLISPKREPMMFSLVPASVEEELVEEQPTSGKINETVFWEYDTETKTLTVSGEGDIPGYVPGVVFDRMTEEEKAEYPYEIAPWDAYLMEMKKLIIGEGITSIGDFNFTICVNLENVEFNDGLISIGNYCFVYCLVIKSITFPSTLVSMGEECFDYCLSLEELYFNDGFKTLGEYCFDSILFLEKAYFPESFETENFYLHISGAGEITINSSVNFIIDVNKCFDEHSFEAYKLYNKVYYKYALGLDNNFLPPEELDENEFIRLYISEYNEKFDTSYDPENEEDVKIIEEIFAALGFQYFADENLVFNLSESSPVHETCKRMYIKHFVGDSTEECNCFVFEGKVCDTIDLSIDVDTKTLTLSGSGSYPVENDFDIRSYMYANNYIENVVYAEDSTMDAIGGYDFDGMDILSITIPANIELIRNNAFQNCRKLTNVIIEGEGRKGGTIWPNAFKNCYSLKSIDIPENFGWLSDGAFAGSSLERITIRDPYCTIGGEAGDPATIPESTVIYGYRDSTAEAFASKNNRAFKAIDEFTVDNLEYVIGKLSGYEGDVVTITGYTGKAETVTIPEQIEGLDVVKIGASAFRSNKYIRTLNLSDDVGIIGSYAFENSSLETVNFGANLTTIDHYAFNGCNNLKTVNVKDFETWNSISFVSDRSNPLFYAENFTSVTIWLMNLKSLKVLQKLLIMLFMLTKVLLQ